MPLLDASMLIHHTDCGMQTLTDDGFRAELQEASGVAPSFAIESFTNLEDNVSTPTPDGDDQSDLRKAMSSAR